MDLYNILLKDRSNLSSFLKQNSNYDFLNKELSKYPQSINNLLLGKIGLEVNKQKAIYELPTNELISIIKYICEFLGIVEIEELGAGMGLLSCLLKYKLGDNYNIVANDSNTWLETSNTNKYYNVGKKKFSQYNENYDNKLIIISWIADNNITEFVDFIIRSKPKYLIIINDNFNNLTNIIKEKLKTNYDQSCIPVKQICYLDNLNSLKNNSPKSSIIFATSDLDISSKLLLNIKLRFGDLLVSKQKINSYKVYMSDAIIRIGEKYRFILENTNMSEACIILSYILGNTIIIPDYLDNYEHFRFWYDRETLDDLGYPTKINDINKFLEYYDLVNKLDDFEELKKEGVIADWVDNSETAEIYIWLEFSTKNKLWKRSLEALNNKYQKCLESNNL